MEAEARTFHRRIARFPAGEPRFPGSPRVCPRPTVTRVCPRPTVAGPRTVPWYTRYRIFAVVARLVRAPERAIRTATRAQAILRLPWYLSNPSFT
eukprot:4578204-Prymnesium_polylepis.1